jgi:hypothetical protein
MGRIKQNIQPILAFEAKVNLNNIYECNSCPKENTTHIHCRDNVINSVQGNNHYLFWQSYESHKCTLCAKFGVTEC